MTWIAEKITNAYPIFSVSDENALLDVLLESVYGYRFPADLSQDEIQKLRRRLLAAAFDLMVAAEYYRAVGHLRWVYCPIPGSEPMAYYPYTSLCPRCVLDGKFYFHQANKPSSGSIGATTSRLLGVFMKALFERHGRKIEILRGSEPVDSIFLDKSTEPHVYLFAEVKSAPLVTLPLAMTTERLTFEEDQAAVSLQTHKEVTMINLYKTSTSIFVPIESPNMPSGWVSKNFPIGNKEDEKDSAWAYRGLTNLLKSDPSFFQDYSKFWLAAFDAYGALAKLRPVFWFTNACGQPSPRPADWPKRSRGDGHESISDSKTSVGMDRTDDIKKSIYQVLKLGAEGKPSQDTKYLVGIVSNIHAVRHFDEYLTALKDIVWTRDETGKVIQASQLPPDTALF
ncbi:MAG: hypothetical protein HC875_02925 [Anaerolineales bacterium]|nr:hypothetical protein [Anaerolineales bacterium]